MRDGTNSISDVDVNIIVQQFSQSFREEFVDNLGYDSNSEEFS
jgi:hypothetical protein